MYKPWYKYLAVQWSVGKILLGFQHIARLTRGRIFCNVLVTGAENLEIASSPLIIASNHRSFFDSFFVLVVLMRHGRRFLPIRPLAADWLFRIPYFGWLVRFFFKIFGVYRLRKNLHFFALKEAIVVLQNSGAVLIFPEGGIPEKDDVDPIMGVARVFKDGAAFLSRFTKAEILPVALCGLEGADFFSLFLGRHKVTVAIGNPIVFSNTNDESATRYLRSQIISLYQNH